MKNYKLLTGRENKNLTPYKNFLVDSKSLESFLLLKEAASKEGFDLEIISAFRDFNRQEKIWNDKATGKRTLLDQFENQVDIKSCSEHEILKAIMHFSAIPGASRHHWGTDIDVFDANKKKSTDVSLTMSECIDGGEFCDLHLWLDEVIANNKSFGFFRPYEKDLGGVAQEKWHLSYSPLSQKYLNEYEIDLFIKNIEESDMCFKNLLLDQVDEFYLKYIKNITPPPF